jgi:hypothetical protein
MLSEGDTLLSGCCLLLTISVQNPSKFKIQICHSHLVLLDMFISKVGWGEGGDEYIEALQSNRNCLKEMDQVLVFFNLFVPWLLFSLCFSYLVSDPQLELEFRSLSLEGNWIIKGHSIYRHSFIEPLRERHFSTNNAERSNFVKVEL